jgi:hypothetical protein
MKWIRTVAAVVVTLGMSASSQAGLFSFGGNCGAEKSCGCAPTCQPRCCKPTIQRPCEGKTFTYQRACSTLVKPCCKPSCCAPANSNCCPPSCAPACGPNGPGCAAPCNTAGGNHGVCAPACAPKCGNCAPACAPMAKSCAAPCGPACGPNGATCAAPCAPACGPKGADCAAPCGNSGTCAPACGPTGPGCAAPCGPACGPNACGAKACCGHSRNCEDACKIAELIYESQTACYAKDRRKAIDRLGDRYNCCCNPEIMMAFVYALNDCDERVRAEAADEIGDQVRRNGCCCMCEKTVAALTCALADCDRHVRHEAEEALEACGYKIVDCCKPSCGACGSNGNCHSCKPCGPVCNPNCNAPIHAAPATPTEVAPEAPAAPAPAPAEEGVTRFPSKKRSNLANLFGLLH